MYAPGRTLKLLEMVAALWKELKKKRFMQILCRLKPYSFRFSSLRTTCCNSPEGFLEGIASQFRINETRVIYEYVYVS